MNKLRLIRIYELRGKVHPIEATIIELLDGIGEFTISKHIYYAKDESVYFSYIKESNSLFLYVHIYNILKWSDDEIMGIMKYLLGKHLKLKFNE